MGKNNKTNSEIYESLIEDYIEDNNISKISSVISNIHNLIDDNLGWKITKNEYYGSPYALYRVACKFIQKYNKSIKYNRRDPEKYEFGSPDTILAKYDPKLIKLTKYILYDGKYIAKLDNDTYCILILGRNDNNDTITYYINTTLYIIGYNWKKWKNKFCEKLNNYSKLDNTENDERIYYSNKVLNAKFKSFNEFICKDKNKIIEYIDNWVNNIPTYYNKYNIIPKLSILLYGPPGTGKSTFYKALAKYLGIRNVYNLNTKYFESENDGYRYSNAIYAIDDIDCICDSRENNKNKNNSYVLSNLLTFLDNPPTFNYIAKDGVNYPISIVIATTNYYDKLDPAVKRYGRFDLTIKMDNFNKDEAQEMCDIYGLELSNVVKNSNSNKFSISPAKLQALCLKNIDNKLKGNLNNKEYINGRIVIHRIKK